MKFFKNKINLFLILIILSPFLLKFLLTGPKGFTGCFEVDKYKFGFPLIFYKHIDWCTCCHKIYHRPEFNFIAFIIDLIYFLAVLLFIKNLYLYLKINKNNKKISTKK